MESSAITMTEAQYKAIAALVKRNGDSSDTAFATLGTTIECRLVELIGEWHAACARDEQQAEYERDALAERGEERYQREERQRFENDMRIN